MALTRLTFARLCTEAILSTREKITISNQLSGYIRFHKVNKKNYVDNTLRPLIYTIAAKRYENANDYLKIHDLIEHVAVGHCRELADHLLVEVGRRIHEAGAIAEIRIVKSRKMDHGYLEVDIQLKDERMPSRWQVDAWDPRIIDISTREDGSIKNRKSLRYGYRSDTYNIIYSNQIDYSKKYFFKEVPKPEKGRPKRDRTPERDMLNKHDYLYSDYTLEKAITKKRLLSSDRLHYLQKASIWQKVNNEQPSDAALDTYRHKRRRLDLE